MILEYCKQNKITTLDINEAQNNPPFCNTSINRKLPLDGMITVLEYMSKTGNAAAIDKNKNKWEVYWHSLEEWGNIIYSWASENAMTNSVCTLFEIVQGDNSTDQGKLINDLLLMLF